MSTNRQRIQKVPGSRRAKLTPAPGTRPEPVPEDERASDAAAAASDQTAGPNDERLRRDVPPHW